MAKDTKESYIARLLKPVPDAQAVDRKVWSVPLSGVWVPFFLATNTAGQTAVSADVLGAPLRLQREQDGTPKFSSKGKPVIRVAGELADQVKMVRENFVAGLRSYTASVQEKMAEEYKQQLEAAQQAGEPIKAADEATLTNYYEAVAAAGKAAASGDGAPAEEEAAAPSSELETVAA